MMEGSVLSAPNASITMSSFHVTCIAQRLRHETVLEREILIAIAGDTFIDRPREGTVVNHDITAVIDGQGVIIRVCIFGKGVVSQPAADIAQRDIMRFLDDNRIVRNTDSLPGGGLSENGHIAVQHLQRRIQMDRSANSKNDDTRTGLVHGITECTWHRFIRIYVVQTTHFIHRSALRSANGRSTTA